MDYTGGYPGILKRYDIATGAVLAQRAFQSGRNPVPIAVHPRSGRLYITTMTGPDPGDDGNLLVTMARLWIC